MAKEYLDRLTTIMQPAITGKFENVSLEYKHFFSGAAVYADGRICMTLTPAGFAIKLPENLRETLLLEHNAEQLRYFPKGPIKKDYAILPDSMLKDEAVLRHWVVKSIEYALTLPRPTKKTSK